MRTWIAAVALCATGLPAVANATNGVNGLCAAGETIYFACATTKDRWASLCGTNGRAPQYRFGRVGETPQLAYPAVVAEAADKLFFSHYQRYQKDRIDVRFDNDGASYVLFDEIEGSHRRTGIEVTDAAGRQSSLLCKPPVTSRLRDLEKLIRCDRDSALNGGNCP